MKINAFLSSLLFLVGSQFTLHSQVIIDTLYFATDGIDAQVYSGASTTNYGTIGTMDAYWDYASPIKISRSYFKMDLSSIPVNAIVTKADIHLYAESVNNGVNHPMWLARITSTWTETGITYNSVPTVTSVDRKEITHAATASAGWSTTEITPLVQYQVVNPAANYGYRINLQSETGTVDNGVTFATSESSTSGHRPYMIIEYRLPLTDTIYFDADGVDSRVYSGASGTNYGTDKTTTVDWDFGATSYSNRTFLQADLSNIPRNAIVTKADLYLYALSVNNAANHPMYVEYASSNWTETGLTWANQPTVATANRSAITHAATSSTGWHLMGVKNTVQVAVNLPEKNFGWRISLQSESGTTDNGVIYASSEHDTARWRPYIIVEYQLPIEIDGYVTHCTNGNNDGSITGVTVEEGCHSYVSYSWMKLTSGTFSTIETGTNVETINISGLADGLYVLDVTDYRSVKGYRYFFVGEEGTTTNVEFAVSNTIARARYGEDAWLQYIKSPADSNRTSGYSTSVACLTSNSYDSRSFVDYKVDWDPSLEYIKADQTLFNKGGHYQSSSSNNDAWISRATGVWHEYSITWANRPAVSTEGRAYIVTTTTNGYSNIHDTVDILGLVPHWQEHQDENFGFELALNDYTQTVLASRDYGSTDYTDHNLIVSFKVKPVIETFFYDSLGTGDITINAPSAELPYTYLIGYDTLPVFDSIWYAVKDSIPVDSITFYRGRENTRNYTFTDLPNDHYFIGVYDNNGELIYSGDTYLSPLIQIYDSVNVEVDSDTIKVQVGETEATATILALLPLDESGGFEIEIVTLDDDLVVGFDNVDDPFPTYTRDLLYAYEITTSGKVYAMKGFEKLDSITVTLGDKLKMEIDFGILSFYKNQAIFASDTLSDTLVYDLKLQVLLKGADSKALFKMLSKGTKIPKLKYTIEHADCGDSEGSITLIAPGGSFFPVTADGYTIYDQNNDMVTSGSGTGTVPLTPGVYTIIYTYSLGFGSYSFTQPFVIGYNIIWANLTNIDEFTTPYHYTTPTSPSTIGSGYSANQTDQLSDNFIQYSHSPYLPFGPASFSVVLWENTSTEMPFGLIIAHAGYSIISKFALVFDENIAIVTTFTPTLQPVRVELASDGTVRVYDNNVLKTSFGSSVSGNLKVVVYESKNVKLVKPVVSFCYPPNKDFVAKTKPNTDGSYFIINGDILTFQYTGEYNQSDLIYDLVGEAGNVISTSFYSIDVTGSTGILKKNADNRYTLDTDALPAGFYLLTVTNVKGEKHYLRIKI